MNIVHIVTQMEAAGAQGAMIRLHKEMMNRTINSHAIFLYKKRSVYESVPGVTVLFDRKPESVIDFIKILYRLFCFLVSLSNVRIMCYTHYSNIIGATIGRLAKVSKVIISHRNPLTSYSKSVATVDYLLGILGFYDRIVCVSNTVFDSFSNRHKNYIDKMVVVLNGVSLNNGLIHKRCASASEYLDLVTTGRLHAQKNHMVIFEAIRVNKNIRLFIAGEGNLRSEYENYIKINSLSTRIILVGELDPADVYQFVAMGDIFVFPSLWEAFGFSVVEAMALGLPVIASDIPAMREVVGDAGVLVDPNNPDAWSKVLSDIISQKFDLDDMRRKSINRAKLYSFDLMYSSYLSLLND